MPASAATVAESRELARLEKFKKFVTLEKPAAEIIMRTAMKIRTMTRTWPSCRRGMYSVFCILYSVFLLIQYTIYNILVGKGISFILAREGCLSRDVDIYTHL